MQREKDDIRRAACVDNAPADKLTAALFAAAQRNTLGTQRVEIGLGLRSRARGYRLIRKAVGRYMALAAPWMMWAP